MISCYEVGYDGLWLHRLLENHAVRNRVIDPASLQVDRLSYCPQRGAASLYVLVRNSCLLKATDNARKIGLRPR
jgi:hypothetical protein